MVTLDAELANDKTAQMRLTDVSARAGEEAGKAQTELRNLQARFSVVAGEAEVATERLEHVWQQSVKLIKTTEELSRQLIEL